MTEDELATIEARANASQPGPWWVVTVGKDHDDGPSHIIMSEYVSITEAFAGGEIPQAVDAEFMAKARADVPALVAEVRRLAAERDAAFNRGVEAMREAAAKVAAECASERGHTQATMFAANRPDDAFVVGIKGGEASRIEALIRALKVAP